MRYFRTFAFSGICMLVHVALSAQTLTGNMRDIQLIQEKTKAFSASYMAADYDGLANAYTVDAKILPPGASIISGREAIKKRWTLPANVKILLHQVEPEEITVLGNVAYDVGYYNGKTQRADGKEVEWKGKYLIVWKKVNGNWKIHMDAWNTVD